MDSVLEFATKSNLPNLAGPVLLSVMIPQKKYFTVLYGMPTTGMAGGSGRGTKVHISRIRSRYCRESNKWRLIKDGVRNYNLRLSVNLLCFNSEWISAHLPSSYTSICLCWLSNYWNWVCWYYFHGQWERFRKTTRLGENRRIWHDWFASHGVQMCLKYCQKSLYLVLN